MTEKRGRLTDEERAEIERMADKGKSPAQIARKLNRLDATINFAMTSMGLREQKPRSFAFERRGRAVRSFGPEELQFIQTMRAEGATTPAIGTACTKRFGHRRSAATICTKLRALATADEARTDGGQMASNTSPM